MYTCLEGNKSLELVGYHSFVLVGYNSFVIVGYNLFVVVGYNSFVLVGYNSLEYLIMFSSSMQTVYMYNCLLRFMFLELSFL